MILCLRAHRLLFCTYFAVFFRVFLGLSTERPRLADGLPYAGTESSSVSDSSGGITGSTWCIPSRDSSGVAVAFNFGGSFKDLRESGLATRARCDRCLPQKP